MIVLVRHGQTDWNLRKVFNGGTDSALNQTGIAQAERQAEALRDIAFDACFCSPQTRARQTAEILYRGEIVFDERLAEIGCGAFEGSEETPQTLREFWQAVQTGARGTEHMSAFMERNGSFCGMLRRHHAGENVLLVTHAANARVLNYFLSGRPEGYDFGAPVAQNGERLVFENPLWAGGPAG